MRRSRTLLAITRGSFVLCFLLFSRVLPAGGDSRQAPASIPKYDIVGVGHRPGEIVLATLALGRGDHWRFRRIPVEPKDAAIESTTLSRSGSKLYVVFRDGRSLIVDLTGKIERIDAADSTHSDHHLPGQLFPVRINGKTCLADDAMQVTPAECFDVDRASVLGDGRVLYAESDGSLSVVRTGTTQTLVPPFRVPAGARYELLTGIPGERFEVLVLVARGNEVQVVNPMRPESPLAAYSTWEQGGIRAMLEFSGAGIAGDTEVPALAENLLKEARGTFEWSFFRVKPDVKLYAPVLEFAPGETAYTSDVNIWDVLNPLAKGTLREDYQRAYDTLGAQRFSRCTSYYRATSFPGSWLLEYWYYYPFDEGKPHRHIHDSEHVFIEVDKLGGAVRSYIASDHGSFPPNNGYSTFSRGATPISLPLFALVELDKHAMSPDINRDGQFTRGVDENNHPLKYEAWGVRDVATQPQHLMKSYKPSMTLPRKIEDRMALHESSQYFSGLEVPAEKLVCSLRPLPDELPATPEPAAKTNPAPTGAQAMAHLVDHPDSLHPRAIYKPWVLPYRQLRLGVAPFDHNGNHDQLYAAYVLDIPHLTRGALPVPARVAWEIMWSPSSRGTSLSSAGRASGGTISSETYFGARYEGFGSTSQGYYFGVTPQFRRFTTNTVDGVTVPQSAAWQYNKLWYRAGYMFELPSRVHGNMTHHVGIIFHGHTVRFEWRISFGILRQRGRDHFGISADDR